MENLTFGAWLRRRRGLLDLTQKTLAYRAGCSVGTIRKLEAGERRPSRQLATLLAQALDIPPEQKEAFIAFAGSEAYEIGVLLPLAVHADHHNTAAILTNVREASPRPIKHNLPAPTTPFFGRDAEIESISGILARPEYPLLTLTGVGGTGKTRLGLQAAAENLNNFPDGVFFVPLAPIGRHDFVLSSIMESLGVEAFGGKAPLERLQEFLADRQMLLLLDNFEHVIEAAPLISSLLARAPLLNILVTSRVLLHLIGEHVYQVEPLTLPDMADLPATEVLAEIEAVQLFVDRAGAVKAGFTLNDQNAEAIAQICTRLDGLPLAIELAAARSRMFPPQAMLQRLESRMAFVISSIRDLPPRQRTLRATIDWSHDLLPEDEQVLFRRLTVFSGGVNVDAAESICITTAAEHGGLEQSLDVLAGLERLLDHNLLRASESHGEVRFFMLETIREYALERLEESGEADLMRRRHADYFLALAKVAEPQLRRADLIAWLARLEMEHDNMRAALSWLSENDVEAGLQMAATLTYF